MAGSSRGCASEGGRGGRGLEGGTGRAERLARSSTVTTLRGAALPPASPPHTQAAQHRAGEGRGHGVAPHSRPPPAGTHSVFHC